MAKPPEPPKRLRDRLSELLHRPSKPEPIFDEITDFDSHRDFCSLEHLIAGIEHRYLDLDLGLRLGVGTTILNIANLLREIKSKNPRFNLDAYPIYLEIETKQGIKAVFLLNGPLFCCLRKFYKKLISSRILRKVTTAPIIKRKTVSGTELAYLLITLREDVR